MEIEKRMKSWKKRKTFDIAFLFRWQAALLLLRDDVEAGGSDSGGKNLIASDDFSMKERGREIVSISQFPIAHPFRLNMNL